MRGLRRRLLGLGVRLLGRRSRFLGRLAVRRRGRVLGDGDRDLLPRLDEVGAGQAGKPVRLWTGLARLVQLAVLRAVAKLVLGDSPQGVARGDLHDPALGLGQLLGGRQLHARSAGGDRVSGDLDDGARRQDAVGGQARVEALELGVAAAVAEVFLRQLPPSRLRVERERPDRCRGGRSRRRRRLADLLLLGALPLLATGCRCVHGLRSACGNGRGRRGGGRR